MLFIIKELVLGIALAIFGIIDWKRKEIPTVLLGITAIVGIGCCFVENRSLVELACACIPGLTVLCFARMSKESIGYGDGLLILEMAFFLSCKEVIVINMMAFGVGGVVALFLVSVYRKTGKAEIPFVPFLALSYGIWMIKNMGI